jgi:hypothetical protein
MRVSEIIRQVLDAIDSIEQEQPEHPVEDMGYSENDIKRFKQIAGLEPGTSSYTTAPNEQYADISAVTVDAGAIGVNGTKEPEDLRGNSFKIYPDKDRS